MTARVSRCAGFAGTSCLASDLNYLDRQTLSVLAQTIRDELRITTIQYADVTFAFLISYTAMYAVIGWIVDRLGSRRSFVVFVSRWSLATIPPVLCLLRMKEVWGFIVALTLPAEVFSHRVVGVVTGLGGAVGGWAGARSQKAIGWTVQNVSFTPIFAVCSVDLTAFALVCLPIGETGRTRELPA